MGRRRLLPDLNSLMLQFHLPHRNSKGAPAVSVVSNVASPSSAAYEHKSTQKQDQQHVFSWPSLKHVLSSSSLACNEKEQGNENHDCANTNDSKRAQHGAAHSHSQHQHSVSFADCNIRTYPQVLGDHPCCSEGCPIQLGWSYTNETSIKVDEYESLYHTTNTACQTQEELRLTPEERRSILIFTKQQYNKQYSNSSCSTSNKDDTRDQEQDSLFSTADCERQEQHERELSRECRRMNRCNDNVKASRKRNRRNQHAFFGTMANDTSSIAHEAVAAVSLSDAAAAIGDDNAPTTIVQNGPC